MFIPFLPLILAALALSLVVFDPSRNEGVIDLSLFQYAGILLSGSLLLAQVTMLFKGRFRSNYLTAARNVWNARINHSRVLTWVLWYVLLYAGAPDQRIQAALPVVAQAESLSFLILLISYWVSDSLSSSPIRAFSILGLWEKGRVMFQHSRIQFPILLLGTFQFLWHILLQSLPAAAWNSVWMRIELITSLFLLFMAAPPILVHCWGARHVENEETGKIIREELLKNQVRRCKIIQWPYEVLPHATAGVIGLLPGFRYLLISPVLAERLSPSELKSVVAHESGHFLQSHLLFFVLATSAQ